MKIGFFEITKEEEKQFFSEQLKEHEVVFFKEPLDEENLPADTNFDVISTKNIKGVLAGHPENIVQ